MDAGKGEFTVKGNRKKASYELVSEWVSETWKELDVNLLVRSFEAAGLALNPDGSEDYKMSNRLQAIVANRMDEVNFDDNDGMNFDEDNENNAEGADSESGDDDELYVDALYDDNLYENEPNFDLESIIDIDLENMVDLDN